VLWYINVISLNDQDFFNDIYFRHKKTIDEKINLSFRDSEFKNKYLNVIVKLVILKLYNNIYYLGNENWKYAAKHDEEKMKVIIEKSDKICFKMFGKCEKNFNLISKFCRENNWHIKLLNVLILLNVNKGYAKVFPFIDVEKKIIIINIWSMTKSNELIKDYNIYSYPSDRFEFENNNTKNFQNVFYKSKGITSIDVFNEISKKNKDISVLNNIIKNYNLFHFINIINVDSNKIYVTNDNDNYGFAWTNNKLDFDKFDELKKYWYKNFLLLTVLQMKYDEKNVILQYENW